MGKGIDSASITAVSPPARDFFIWRVYKLDGLKEVGDYYNYEISKECDLLFIQEHCLYKCELTKICKLWDGMFITSKSYMDECIARKGRPYGGCAILWKLALRTAVREPKCSRVRLCGIMIDQYRSDIECKVVLQCMNAMCKKHVNEFYTL